MVITSMMGDLSSSAQCREPLHLILVRLGELIAE
jgi:hypothetical protein